MKFIKWGKIMFQIDFAARTPIYEQLYYNVIRLASAGAIKPGDKLPPVRVIAAQLGINPNTAAKAYKELENDGYIFSSVGRGSYLTDKLEARSAQRLMVLKELKTAVKNAVNFGVEKEQMTEIIDKAFSSVSQ